MRNTVIDLKQKKTIKTIDIYRVVDLESGEEGGWVSKDVQIDRNSWVGKANAIIMPQGSRLSLQNTIIDGAGIQFEVRNGLVLLKDCSVRPYTKLSIEAREKVIISDSVFGTGSSFIIDGMDFSSVSVNNLNLGNSAVFKVGVFVENVVGPDLIPAATFNDISILNLGRFFITDCKGDVLVNKVLVGEDCSFQLDNYWGVMLDEFECREDSKFALSNTSHPKLSKFGNEIIIVDTDIGSHSYVNLNSAGGVILDNQVVENAKLTDDDVIVNGVFKSKNQFVEEWNIE